MVFIDRPSRRVNKQSFSPRELRSFVILVYTLHAVVLVPEDRIRRVLQFDKDITDAISDFKRMGSTVPVNPEWELPIYLKSFAIEADFKHHLEILDTSLTQGKLRVWEVTMEQDC